MFVNDLMTRKENAIAATLPVWVLLYSECLSAVSERPLLLVSLCMMEGRRIGNPLWKRDIQALKAIFRAL